MLLQYKLYIFLPSNTELGNNTGHLQSSVLNICNLQAQTPILWLSESAVEVAAPAGGGRRRQMRGKG